MKNGIWCAFGLLLPRILFLVLISNVLSAQIKDGATPLSSPQGTTPHSALRTPHSTRAVVVGISDYQDPGISDLQYAHRDAEAFAEWLRSPAGGEMFS